MSVGESQSLGETLRRQGIFSFEMRVGRTTATVRMIAKMVMVMFCLFSGMTAITFFILEQLYMYSRGRIYRRMSIWLNKRMGCESPRCRRCKCRDNLPLMEVSHWNFLNSEKADRLLPETQVRRPTGMTQNFFAPVRWAKRFCGHAKKQPRQ